MMVPILQFDVFAPYSKQIIHGISTRQGGKSEGDYDSLNLDITGDDDWENVEANYKKFTDALGVDLEKIVLARQAHTDTVVKVDADTGRGIDNPVKDVDAFMTDVRGIPLLVRFADCQGALFYDPVKRVVAAVHSGWRGNVQNILGKTVKKMVEAYGCNPADIVVGISPSLEPKCAEFTDPKSELPEEMHKYIEGKTVDLWQCSYDQLTEAGLSDVNVEIMKHCTVCESNNFFSYRRAGGKDGKTGRMAAMIQLT